MADLGRLGQRIKRARKARGLGRAKLAEIASALPGAPDITPEQVRGAERGRAFIRLGEDDTETEPLIYILKALGMEEPLVSAAAKQ
jgi:transcriptional regulator with XRE-family HTH domain